MKKILIVQNMVLHYRKPVYNELSQHYEVTIQHSGSKSVGDDDKYKELIVPVKRTGPFFLQSGVLTEMRTGQYDVVIAMFDIRWLANIIAVFFRKGSRFIYWGHRYSKFRFVNKLRDTLIRVSDGVILYSDSEIDRMMSRGVSPSKIFVAPNTIHIPNHSDGSSCYKDSFLFVGRAQKRKRVDKLIRAFSEILDRIPEDIKINIVGSGEENDELKSFAKSLGVSDRVLFHGEIIDNGKLKPFFERAYAYVSPGHVGLGILHSFAYGVPVVTDKSVKHAQEYDNLKDLENALLFRTFDKLKEILISLCNDDNLSRKLGNNAYEFYVRERSLEHMVGGFRCAIENVREEGVMPPRIN